MKRLAAAALATAFLLIMPGCEDATFAPQAPAVTVAEPERRVVESYDEYSGTTRATEFAQVRARVSGTLEKILFEPTTLVKQGEPLFEIERAAYQARYDSAVADLQGARSRLAKEQANFGRMEEAAKQRAVSQADVDTSRAQRDLAQADVLQAKARLDQATLDLDYTRPVAPFDGLVGRNLVDVGNLVGAGEPTILTTMNSVSPIYVYFNAPEEFVLALLRSRPSTSEREAGDEPASRQMSDIPVRAATADDEEFPHLGVLDFIGNTVDAATGTIELRAVFPNEDLVLFPGLFVRVRVVIGEGEAIVVDERAIGSDLGGKYLLTIGEGNVVEQTYVTLGQPERDGTIVVEEGLDGDELVITNGLLRARPGFPVVPQTEAQVEAAEAAKAETGEAD